MVALRVSIVFFNFFIRFLLGLFVLITTLADPAKRSKEKGFVGPPLLTLLDDLVDLVVVGSWHEVDSILTRLGDDSSLDGVRQSFGVLP